MADDTLKAGSQGADATLASGAGASDGPVRVQAGQRDYPLLTAVERSHYAIGEEIARGGMGRIFKARDRRLGRTVAIKELLVESEDLRVRFEREARITATLQHPAIVNILEAGTWPTGEPFYAMKLVTGRSLDKVVAGTRTIAERLALLPSVVAVVDALAYAHDRSVIHRDLKPANVLVGDFGETVVIDWGLAKDLSRQGGEPDVAVGPFRGGTAGETMAGAIMGTPAYMPPEQARGDALDATADVYSLGALLYHVLAGRPPYDGDTADGILEAVLDGPPPALSVDVPADLTAIVGKAMARDASGRYATAAAMATDLKAFTAGRLVDAHRYTLGQLLRRWARRHRAVLATSAIAFAVLAGVATYGVVRIRDQRDQAEASEQRALDGEQHVLRDDDERLVREAHDAVFTDPALAVATLARIHALDARSDAIGEIVRYAVAAGIPTVMTGARDPAIAIAFDRSGDRVLSIHGGDHAAVFVWDRRRTGDDIVVQGLPSVTAYAIAPDLAGIVIAGADSAIAIDPRTRHVVRLPVGGTSAAISNDGAVVAIGRAHSVAVCTLAGDPACRPIIDSGRGGPTLALSPDHRWLAVADQLEHVWVVDLSTSKLIGRRIVPARPQSVYDEITKHAQGALRIVAGGSLVYVDAGCAPFVADIPAGGGELVDRTTRPAHSAGYEPVVITEGADRAVCLGGDGDVVDVHSGAAEKLAPTLAGRELEPPVVDANARVVARAGAAGRVQLVHAGRAQLQAPPGVVAPALSADGRWFAAGSRDGVIRVWSTADVDVPAASERASWLHARAPATRDARPVVVPIPATAIALAAGQLIVPDEIATRGPEGLDGLGDGVSLAMPGTLVASRRGVDASRNSETYGIVKGLDAIEPELAACLAGLEGSARSVVVRLQIRGRRAHATTDASADVATCFTSALDGAPFLTLEPDVDATIDYAITARNEAPPVDLNRIASPNAVDHASHVREGAVSVTGRLPPEVVHRVVRASFDRLGQCYEAGLAAAPFLSGRVTVELTIDRTGAVSAASERGHDLADAGVARCVVKTLGGLSFPAPDDGTVTVVYPIVFPGT